MESGSTTSSLSESSSSSGTDTSGTDTGSSSDTDSTTSAEEKGVQSNAKAQVGRRKSSDVKTTKPTPPETETKQKTSNVSGSATRTRPAVNANAGNAVQRSRRNSTITSDDEDEDTPPTKKPIRATNTNARRKSTAIAPAVTPKAVANKLTGSRSGNLIKAGARGVVNEQPKQSARMSPTVLDESIRDNKTPRKGSNKMTSTTASAVRAKQLRNNKSQAKRNLLTKGNTTTVSKSSEDSEDTEETGSASADDSSSSESEGTDSSNSYTSQNAKNIKQKKTGNTGSKLQNSDTDEAQTSHPMRKLTRSFSMRRTKQPVKPSTDSDSDIAEIDGVDKRSLSKSPAKKPTGVNNVSKCKVKKEMSGFPQMKSRAISPLAHLLEKNCPIEGCDSSGHLSGNLDRHFLPEACPIYHNMSASECKERANERKIRFEQRQKLGINANSYPSGPNSSNKPLTPEQKEFLAKIKESRARFRPISNNLSDKVKLEKDCTDEDREPSLVGLVPDYDLQLFREAQSIASEKVEDELQDLPVGKGIKYITMGKYKMKVWYQSPYPDDAARLPKMYICEFCLRYQKSQTGIKRHAQKCIWRHPPGDEIYRKGKLQVWQVDGKRFKQYCQHLCLLAKFFLDHKTLYYDVEPFLFYIMTLADVDGCHIVGYFSKEKNSFYNVSCILTLPPYQRKGYGRLLIDFSYLLTRVEGKIGSPEKPLSDLGLISYRSYWKDVLLDYLCNRSGNTLSIKDVSQEMAIYSYDIVSTLQALGMMKYWKGKHIVLKKQDVLDEYEERVKRRGTFPKIDDSCLRWQPFVPAQTNTSP